AAYQIGARRQRACGGGVELERARVSDDARQQTLRDVLRNGGATVEQQQRQELGGRGGGGVDDVDDATAGRGGMVIDVEDARAIEERLMALVERAIARELARVERDDEIEVFGGEFGDDALASWQKGEVGRDRVGPGDHTLLAVGFQRERQPQRRAERVGVGVVVCYEQD